MNPSPGNFLDYFARNYGTAVPGEILWSHAVNDTAKLQRVLDDNTVMIIESDIRISSDKQIIAAHPPALDSDLTLAGLLTAVKNSSKGLKLDFKDPEAVIPSLKALGDLGLENPVILNADILQGNGAAQSRFEAGIFISACQGLYPNGFLSLGWTTLADTGYPYTANNINEMLEICTGFSTVTFPVRACLVPSSWPELQRLIAKDGYTLSIWNNEPVSIELQNWIHSNTDTRKTFYDFIDENKEPLRFW